MIVQFDTLTITEKDAKAILSLVSPYAAESLLRSLAEVDAVRRDASTATPSFIEAAGDQATEDQAMKNRVVEENEAPKKRGRPKKEVVEVHPTVVEDAAGPTLFDAPAIGNAEPVQSKPASVDGPITIDDLREVVNDHVSRLGMPSAQAILKKFGCERVTAVMDLEAPKQHAVLAALKK